MLFAAWQQWFRLDYFSNENFLRCCQLPSKFIHFVLGSLFSEVIALVHLWLSSIGIDFCSRLEEMNFTALSSVTPGWEPIHYHGPHEMWNIAGEPQKNNLTLCQNSKFTFLKKIKVENRGARDFSWITVEISAHYGVSSLVLARCCVITW